jgi:hypothetical protein
LVDYADRLYDWDAYCGVPGGIPNRTTVYATMTTSNTLAEINAAISACPSGQVMAFAAGTYSLGTISSKSGITVRGAGAGQTIINCTGAGFTPGNMDYISPNPAYWAVTRAIASGYTRGSLSITLASAPTSDWAVGNLMMITQTDDYDLVWHRTGNWAGSQNLRFTTRITSVDGNTISFATPLPYTYTAGLNPICTATTAKVSLFGIENLTLNCTNANPITFSSADRCWIKDVEVSGAEQAGLYFWSSSQCEIRRCYVHDSYGYPTQSDGYSILLQYGNCCFRVEDNIAYRTAHLIYNGSSAIATLNNYFYDTSRASTTWIQPAMDCNHGPHGLMSLWEGNIGSRFQNDGYHGSCSHQTVFRNSLNGLHSSATLERQLVDLSRGSYYHIVVGNILGDSSWNPDAYAATTYADHTLGYIYVLGWGSPDSADPTYDVGWENWTASLPDANVAATILRHGNFDYFNDVTVWDTGITDRAIPSSLFYSSKPAFFGSLAWPPIGPDVSPMVSNIPARHRWQNYLVSGILSDLFADEV